jgi:signal transduction histidine kinase/DNA-binding response OmpR family regulator/streptogramin lyase
MVNNTLPVIFCLETDDQGNLWMGTGNGLYKYHIPSNSLIPTYNVENGGLTSNPVVSLCFDKLHNLWIGTEGGGLNILNTQTGKMDYILPGENKNTLSSESVFSIYEDKEGRKWIGTLKGGINIVDPQKSLFKTLTHDPLNPGGSLIYNFAASFYEDQYRNLWIGTDGGGMSVWNRAKNTFTNFRHQAGNVHSLSNNQVSCIKEDYLGNIWIATFGGGINRFNRATSSFDHFRCINEVTGMENKNVWQLFEDRDKILWATTFSAGMLYRLNRESNKFEIFDQELYDLFAIMEDNNRALWSGDSHQLIKIDKQRKKHTYYEIGKPIRAIYEDKKGNFWIGTEGGGLILFNRKQGQIAARYSDADGLSNNAVLNILEDNKGSLWLSTYNGLSQFDPVTKAFKNYYQDDGLQSNQFLYNAALRLQSGELVFGGIKGFSIFFPDSITARKSSPPVVLTGLRINNIPVTLDSRYVTKITGDKIESLKIPYSEAILSFDFAALEYSAPGKIAYAYYLEGWDKDWNYSGKLRSANYTHLREGTYLLRIRSTNADGTWNPQEVKVRIIVQPPWYRSWWAYSLYLIIIGALIYIYQQYRARQAKLEYEVTLAKLSAAKERAERETEKVVNERDKEINEKRLSFFTHISHEFRTPLTLIINPVKELLHKVKQEESGLHNDLNIVYRNTRRLLSLVDQLLLFRKADEGVDQMKIARLNFPVLCKDVYLAFVQQAKSQNIEYKFECANEALEIYADREKMEIILYNLISNAFKYTPQGGTVSLTIGESEENVDVTVADSGYGIPNEIGEKLFERFYQVHENGVPSKPGFGIGLYLVKHFVDRHKGEISYQSELGKGTTFFIQLRKGKEHFGELSILADTPEDTVLSKILVEEEDTTNGIRPSKEKNRELKALISDNQSILVVDDDEEIRHYISKIFNKFTVHQAGNGDEALVLANEYNPDIIISDVKMPGINGIEFCKTVKDDPALNHIPVILLTAESSLDIKLQGMEGGADDYITKPFEKELLQARVINLLKNRTNLQNYFYNEVTLQQNPLKISAEYKEFLEKCIAIVEQHLDDEDFNVKTLASELGMSHSYVYKKVKSISGQSINAFIRFIRLRKAAELFINTNSNVNETAFQVGIPSIKYFREQFAKQFGMTPSEYIKKYRRTFGKSFNLHEEGYKGKS